jgi:hypothetical protein
MGRREWSRTTGTKGNTPVPTDVPARAARVAGGPSVWEPEPVLSSVFAHQGGWDEILFVVVPIAIFAGLLAVANRRASRIEGQRTQGGSERDGGDGRASAGRRPEPSPRKRGRAGRGDR